MRVLFRESSILVRFFIPFSFALDTMLLPFIRFEARALVPHFATGMYALDFPISARRLRRVVRGLGRAFLYLSISSAFSPFRRPRNLV
eukprot:scaffold4320_cov32-Phaeocystis_antarctica.AAC.2